MADKTPSQLLVDCFSPDKDPSRQTLERKWMRNVLMDMGEQWLLWLEEQNIFIKPGQMRQDNPTPVSNIIRQAKKSIRALFLNKEFTTRVWPNSNEQTDKDAAKLAEDVLQWLNGRRDNEFNDEQEMVVDCVALLGNGFMRVFSGKPGDSWGIDKQGNLLTGSDVLAECIIPQQVVMDTLGFRMRHKRWVGIKTLRDKEWIEDTFGVNVNSDANVDTDDYQRRLMNQVAQVSLWKGAGIEYGGPMDEDLVMFKELELRPTKKYPEGRYIIGVGNQVIKEFESMPIPVQEDGKWSYSLVDFHYNRVTGRFWSDSAVDDLIGPQVAINKIDQALQNNRESVGRPTMVTPVGTTLKRVNKGDLAYLHLEYDPKSSNFVPPQIQYGKALPGQVFDERSLHLATAQDAAGDPKNVLRGSTPSSQASGLMVDILRDTAEQSHMPDINRFYRSMRRVHKLRLVLAQHIYDDGTILKIPGKGNEVYVKAFSGADIRGNTDVRLELASGLSTTNYGKVQTVMGLVEKGLFGDLTQNPAGRDSVLNMLGLSEKSPDESYTTDVSRAEWENSLVANAITEEKSAAVKPFEMQEFVEGQFAWVKVPGDPMGWMVPWIEGLYIQHIYPQKEIYGEMAGKEVNILPTNSNFPNGEAAHYFRLDDHAIHHETHRKFILSKEFAELHPICRRLLLLHDELHQAELMKAAKQEQQAMIEAQQREQADKLRKQVGTDNVVPMAGGQA